MTTPRMSADLLGVFLFDSLAKPDFDDRLPGDSDQGSLLVEFGNHPTRQIHIDPPGFQAGPRGFVPVQKIEIGRAHV